MGDDNSHKQEVLNLPKSYTYIFTSSRDLDFIPTPNLFHKEVAIVIFHLPQTMRYVMCT
jgi:hypothetical protein